MNGQLTLISKFHITPQKRGRKQLRPGARSDQPTGHVPRISRLMALAIRCQELIRTGVVPDQSSLAGKGQITTARMTQIMSLLNLAPDIQEQLLLLPRTELGRDVLKEADIRPIANTLDWRKQRILWATLQQRLCRRPRHSTSSSAVVCETIPV